MLSKNRLAIAFALSVAVALSTGCGPRVQSPEGSEAPEPAEQPASEATEAPATAGPDAGAEAVVRSPDPCESAAVAATAMWKEENPSAGTPPTFEGSTSDSIEGVYDFNGDGTPDCALEPGGDERWLFLMADAGPTFLGTIIADDLFGFSCLTKTTNGVCDISASQQMIHGETQIRRYAFDGKRYRQTSVRLTAPHPKFGP